MALLVSCGLVVGWAAPAAAADGDAPWTVATAADDYGSGRVNFEYTANAGDTVDDGIVVTNTGTDPVDLAVYGADAFTTDVGALDLRAQGAAASDVGSWLAPKVDHVTVTAGASTDVPFSIVVPSGATAGDHVGGIVTSRMVTSGGKQVEQRVALLVHLHVSGFFRPGLVVEDVRTVSSVPAVGSGHATVTYTLRNTGNAILSAEQHVSVGGPFGAFAATAASVPDAPYLLPGESWKVSVDVPGVQRAGWQATTVSLVPLYTDPAGSTNRLDEVSAGTHAWALSWLVVAVVLVVIGLVVGLVLLAVRLARRPRREQARARRRPAPPAGPAAVPPAPATSVPAGDAHAATRSTTT
ncbi:MAG TPA: DUF916 domain-containing protein [Cellulomonas sp.]